MVIYFGRSTGKNIAGSQVEYPYILNYILKLNKDINILHAGCHESMWILNLKNKGFLNLFGIDVKNVNTDINFQNVDIYDYKPKVKFGVIMAISLIEHGGFDVYGGKTIQHGDKEMLFRFNEWLKKDGILLLTVPFGKKMETDWYRVYDIKRLKNIITPYFKIIDFKTYITKKGESVFKEVNPEEAEKINYNEYLLDLGPVACMILKKKEVIEN